MKSARASLAAAKTNEVVSYKPVSFAWVETFRDRVLKKEAAPEVELYVALESCNDGFGFGVEKGDTLLKTSSSSSDIVVSRPWGDTKTGTLPLEKLRLKPRTEWSCEDVCEYVVKTTCMNAETYYVDLIAEESQKNVGKKDFDNGAFVSYARKMPFDDLVKALSNFFANESRGKKNAVYIWMDIFCVNQPKLLKEDEDEEVKVILNSFLQKGLHLAITKFERKVAVFDDWRNPTPLDRAWCVWEIFGVAVAKQRMEIAMTPQQESDYISALTTEKFDDIMGSLVELDVRNAKCFNVKDREAIFQAINDLSSFGEVNETILGELRRWHVATVEREVKASKGGASDKKWHLLQGFVALLYQQGKYAEAKQKSEKALAMSKKLHKKAHTNLAESFYYYGVILVRLKEFAKGEKNLRAALEMRKKLHGERHFEVALVLNALGFLYFEQGQNEEAERLHREALKMLEEADVEVSGHIAVTINNVAGALQRQGKLDEALGLYEKSLAIKKKLYGEDHPEVARVQNNIAQLLLSMGKMRAALSTGKEALEIAKKVLGPAHYLTKEYEKIWG